MSNQLPFAERLQRAFEFHSRGVVGLADDLLGLCRERNLQLDWQANRCQVRMLGAGPQEATHVSISKSVYRAVLARIAALCNERRPHSVSPYGGEGELMIHANPAAVFRVSFVNCPTEQRLKVQLSDGDVVDLDKLRLRKIDDIPTERSVIPA
jgi:hypothetical protein